MRRSAVVGLLVREPPVGGAPSVEHQVGDSSVDGEGNFSIDGRAMFIPATVTSVEEFIRIVYLPTNDTHDITLENVRWGFGTSQTVGPLRTGWEPPERALAEVNGKWFDETKGLANELANALMDANPKPYSARNTKLVLLWEPREGYDYTRMQEYYKELNHLDVNGDFPVRLYKELEKIPALQTRMKNLPDAILNYLFKIAALQQWQIERGKMLETLIQAIGRCFRWTISEDIIEDPIPDMAAVSGLIYIAGRMAKDQGKMSALSYGKRPATWAQSGISTVEMSVGR